MLSQLGAFVRRDWIIARSYRFPFLLGLFSSVVVLIVLHEVGILVDRANIHSDQLSRGYYAFVLVGMAVLGIVHTALRAFAMKLRDEQTTGTLEALLAAPAPVSLVILGSSTYDLVQALGMGLMLLGVGLVSGVHVVASLPSLAAAIADLVGLMGIFAALGVGLAAFTVVFKRGNTLTSIVTAGLALLGGVYFPVSLLPGPIRFVADALPFTWGIDVMRQALLLGQVDVGHTIGVLCAAVVCMPISLWLFHLAVQRARREGSLAQY